MPFTDGGSMRLSSMSHFSGSFWKWRWPLVKWSWCSISQNVLSNALLTTSLIGAAIYVYATFRRTSRAICRSTGSVPAMFNLGNTCYANSLLQGLASSKAFLKWILVIDTKLVCRTRKLMFLDALKQVIQDLNDVEKEICSAAGVIDALLAHRWSIPPNTEQDLYELFNVFVTTWDEELAVLRCSRYSSLEEIAEIGHDNKASSNSIGTYNITRRNFASVLTKNDTSCVQDTIGRNKDSAISHLNSTVSDFSQSPTYISFELVKNMVASEKQMRPPCMGLLAVQLRCCREDCYYKKIREDKFSVLSLSLPRSSDPSLTLSKLLQRYFAAEYIHGASCDRCVEQKKHPPSGLMKKQGFCTLPPLLIFRIERVGFSPNGFVFKRNERFLFPEFIDVRKYCFFINDQSKPSQLQEPLTMPYLRVLGGSASNASFSSPLSSTTQHRLSQKPLSTGDAGNCNVYDSMFKYKYQLRAVSVHIGHAYSGHFITYRRGIGTHDRNTWYKTSDTKVTPVSFVEVASSEAYMLFYDRTLATLK